MSEYRIVTDLVCGYQVQIWRWYWPFWCEIGELGLRTNTNLTKANAAGLAKRHAAKGSVVMRLGRNP